MNRKSKTMLMFFAMSFSLILVCFLNSCGGNSAKSDGNDAGNSKSDDAAFYATQPVHSGLYDADWYDITGANARKGRFDGRIYFSLSPDNSAFYVFENGNRTKIDYIVNLAKPFEKGDSGVYYTTDNKDRKVCIATDSSTYFLKFQRSNEDITIGFNPKPRHEGSALEILEKMAAQKNKNN